MTRIITITSGLDQVGKTQLGINMGLELVRQGRAVGFYHEGAGNQSIHQLLKLPPYPVTASRGELDDVICRGYQGVDIISSRILLSNWYGLGQERLETLVMAHEASSEYDDFLIDTSGISPRGVIACCKLSRLVVLLVTPELKSQAEAFALLKVLCLNEFHSPVVLLVNKAGDADEAEQIHAAFAREVKIHLGLEIPLLGSVMPAEEIPSAQRVKQAFSSIYPESDVAALVVRLVADMHKLQDADERPSTDMRGFWKALAESIRTPVRLAGEASLAEFEQAVPSLPDEALAEAESQHEATLLRFEGPLAKLDNVMQSFSSVMHFIADDMLALHEHLIDLHAVSGGNGGWPVPDTGALEVTLVGILKVLKDSINQQEQVCFQVEESAVNGQDAGWLKAGHYIKYVFTVHGQGDAMDIIREQLIRIPETRHNKGDDGECICEVLSAGRDTCLSVIHTPQGEIRVNYWHQPDRGLVIARPKPVTGVMENKGATVHTENKLLH